MTAAVAWPLWVALKCWPKRHRHVHRHVRHLAGAAASKPAVVVWTCIVIGWPTPIAPAPTPAAPIEQHYYPPEFDIAPLTPPPLGLEFFALPPAVEFPIIGPPILLPDLPAASPPSVAEPSTLALLAGALALLVSQRKGWTA